MAILAISGFAGSGKDTVGDIIKYLTSQAPAKGRTFEEFQARNSNPDAYGDWYNSPWENKSWAYKLKLICSILTGIPVEKFEDQEFKKTLLPAEWGHWTIAITRDGEAVRYLGKYDSEEVAKVYINLVKSVFGTKNTEYDVVRNRITIREMLQKVGTDCLRDGFNKNVWINALMADYQPVDYNPLTEAEIFPNWIITDTRFLNEVEVVREVGGKLIRVVRGGIVPPNNHPSEMELANYKGFDYVLENNGTLDDLIYSVSKMLQVLGFDQTSTIYNYQK